jgi:hypothetical protein
MKYLSYTCSIVLFLFFGCNSTYYLKKEFASKYIKVIDIEEYKYAYLLKGIEYQSKDTIIIVSFKEKFYSKHNLKKPDDSGYKKVNINNYYSFKLLQIKPQVSNMEQLGAFIIVEKDTLWKGQSYKTMPKSHTAQNTIGLIIYE